MSLAWGRFQFPITTYEAYLELDIESQARYERNTEQPLEAEQQLNICGITSHSFLPPFPYNNVSHFHGRQVEAFDFGSPRAQIPIASTPAPFLDGKFKIKLCEPVTTGAPRYSQVWLARAEPGGHPLIVKIFLACFGPGPEWNMHFSSFGGFIPEEELAHREWWAFSRLSHLQGTAIPHSYGFYDVLLPSGDKAPVHVMEHIAGREILRWQWNKICGAKPPPVVLEICERLSEFILECRRHRLAHGDIDWKNILFPFCSPKSCVLIDFAFAQEAAHPRQIQARTPLEMDMSALRRTLECILTSEGFLLWASAMVERKREDREWIEFLIALIYQVSTEPLEWIPPSDTLMSYARKRDEIWIKGSKKDGELYMQLDGELVTMFGGWDRESVP